MSTYEDFLPEVKARAFGLSDPLAELYIRSAAIEFCERTRLWVRQVQEYAFEGDARIVISDLDDENEQLESLVPGWVNGLYVSPIAPLHIGVNLQAFANNDFAGQARGQPAYLFQLPDEDGNTVGIWPVPDKQYPDITFKAVLKPTPIATVLPDFLFRNHRQAIVEGALSKIHEVQGQPFTDPARAGIALARFQRHKLDGEADARRGRTVNGDLVVQMRPFARGRR